VDRGFPFSGGLTLVNDLIDKSVPIVVTGATGYVGGRLAIRLLAEGYKIRCLVRSPLKLVGRPWAKNTNVEVVPGDVGDHASVIKAMEGCQVAYYLVHSLSSAGPVFREHDRLIARNFSNTAAEAGLKRIIYLGGLGETTEGLSEHLSSRREVEEELASGPTPVTVLRAAMIIGSGSASFEILRYLVERAPFMVTPRWVDTECQPISIRNVLNYLAMCLETPETTGMILDIGGPEILTYRQMMYAMAEARRLPKPMIIILPGMSLSATAWWVQMLTPIDKRIAVALTESLKNTVVCRNDDAVRLMPQELLAFRQAVSAATVKITSHKVETYWSDAGFIPGDPQWTGGTHFKNQYSITIKANPDVVFREICKVGGETGYYGADWLWAIRGWMDQLVGGPGLRRGRKDPEKIAYGDAIDFWRVSGYVQDRRLELLAEMRVSGDAYLELDIIPDPFTLGQSILTSTAKFKPKGLLGYAYWFAALPLHRFVFLKMLHGIRDKVERSNSIPILNESAR
jgi:uncharacterized protein YbjT (DUF2867 family)